MKLHMTRSRAGLIPPLIFLVFLAYLPAAAQYTGFTETVQTRLDSLREALDFPGATLAFIMHDGKQFLFSTGFADVENEIPMPVDARMFTGSMGKTFAAATALQLIDEGKFALNDRVSAYLGGEPWFPRLANHDELTIRMIMTHTGGIPRYVFQEAFTRGLTATPQRSYTPEELIAFIFDQPAVHPPGKGWHYSDTDYILLGMIIEKVTGNTFYAEAQKRLLTPLGLDNTFPSDKPQLPGLIPGYTGEDAPPFHLPGKVVRENGEYVINPQFEWCGGGFVTNTTDMTKWAKQLYEGRLFSKRMFNAMLSARNTTTGAPDSQGYGLGVMIFATDHGPVYGHGGIFPGYETMMVYLPVYRCAAAIQINADRFSGRLKEEPGETIERFFGPVKMYYEANL